MRRFHEEPHGALRGLLSDKYDVLNALVVRRLLPKTIEDSILHDLLMVIITPHAS